MPRASAAKQIQGRARVFLTERSKQLGVDNISSPTPLNCQLANRGKRELTTAKRC
jgi:hypothetical protein